MSSWQESSGDRRESIFLTPGDSNSPPKLDPSLLKKVLEKTLDVEESSEPLDSVTRAALLDFARQNVASAELSEALMGDLVRIVLKHETALLAGQVESSAISDQVAQSLWEDPVARGRISSIWRLLRGQLT